MNIWLVRAGAHGEFEEKFLKDGRIYATWSGLRHDLKAPDALASVSSSLRDAYPKTYHRTIVAWTNQIRHLVQHIASDDWVVLPSKFGPLIYVGKVVGNYTSNMSGPDLFRHWRQVKWAPAAISRESFSAIGRKGLRVRRIIYPMRTEYKDEILDTIRGIEGQSPQKVFKNVLVTKVSKISKVSKHYFRGPKIRKSRKQTGGSVIRGTKRYLALANAAPEPANAPLYKVFFGTNRKPISPNDIARGFSSDRESAIGKIHFGTCDVAIPKSHEFGSTGSSWWKRLYRLSDDRIRLVRITQMSEAEFWRMVNSELARSESKEPQALVYLHGYNVSFEDAAIRSAQIGFDLKSTAVTGFFSWPSKATFEGYPADEATIEASEAAITEFLVRFAQEVGAERVHVVAHSMGNRGLLRAMQRIERNAEHLSGIKFGQIFLAAPDVDAELFCELAEAYPRFGRRTTLYSSPSDKAVGLSAWFHGAPRAGFTPPVTIVPGIDTVHVPDFDLDVLGHGYYAAAAGILSDMFDLIHRNSPPSGRQRLTEEMREDRSSYWEMRK